MIVQKLLFFTSLVALAGCGVADELAPPLTATPAEQARVEAAVTALTSELAERLFSALEAGGPLRALEICSRVAQEVALDHSTNGLRIRRVSARVRNPADRPDAWEQARLAEWQAGLASGESPQPLSVVVTTDAGAELRHLQPLLIAPPCLTCHGELEAMDTDLVAKLAELYPDDRAVGYAVGDLRGAVSVRLSLAGRSGAS